jgi:peptidoglycan/xylan/chitin deacetylase (PgdA/CDA1 family)
MPTRQTTLPPLLFLVALSLPGSAAEKNDAAGPQVEIARFAGNRVAAVSYTFDDGTLGHYTVAAPTLEHYGFRGTFGVVARKTTDDPEAAEKLAAKTEQGTNNTRRVSWKEWRELAGKGHEVANHGLEHKGLVGLTDEGLQREVEEARRIITEKVARPLTFIYPGNSRNPQVRAFVLKNHIAARDREDRFGGPGFNVDKANGIIDKAIKTGQAIVVMTHAVAEVGYEPVSKEDLEEHLKYVSQLKDRVWVDTLANVSRYVRERDAAKIAIKASEADRVTFDLACSLDPVLFNGPLTCVIHAGGHVVRESARCERGGVVLPAVVSGDKVLVDVVPGAGEVTVRWTNN